VRRVLDLIVIAAGARILGFVSGLGEDAIAGVLRYRNMAGESRRRRWRGCWRISSTTRLAGRCTACSRARRVVPPPLDLIYFLRQDRD